MKPDYVNMFSQVRIQEYYVGEKAAGEERL